MHVVFYQVLWFFLFGSCLLLHIMCILNTFPCLKNCQKILLEFSFERGAETGSSSAKQPRANVHCQPWHPGSQALPCSHHACQPSAARAWPQGWPNASCLRETFPENSFSYMKKSILVTKMSASQNFVPPVVESGFKKGLPPHPASLHWQAMRVVLLWEQGVHEQRQVAFLSQITDLKKRFPSLPAENHTLSCLCGCPGMARCKRLAFAPHLAAWTQVCPGIFLNIDAPVKLQNCEYGSSSCIPAREQNPLLTSKRVNVTALPTYKV